MMRVSMLSSRFLQESVFRRPLIQYGVREFSVATSPAPYTAVKQKEANILKTSWRTERNETIADKAYRWIDVTGFLTRYNNRKAWVLDQDSYGRLATVMITEYERKYILFMGFHCYLFFLCSLAGFFYMKQHLNVKPPVPKVNYEYMDGRNKDFTWHGRLFLINPKERCKECRWLDLECKKECFERLHEEGHSQVLYGGRPLSKPREKLEAPHFH